MAGGVFMMFGLFLAPVIVHGDSTINPLVDDILRTILEKLLKLEGGIAVLATCKHQKSGEGEGLGAVVAQLVADLQSTNSQLKVTQTDLQSTQTDLQATQTELQSTQAELQTIQTEHQATQTELQTIQTKLQTTQTDLQTTQTDLQTTQTELQTIQTKLQSTQTELQTTQTELQSQLQNTHTDLNATQTELQTTQTELQATQTELQSTQAELQTIQTVHQATQTELQTIQTKLQTTQTDLQTIQTKLQSTQTELQTTQTELQSQLQNTHTDLNATQTELQTTRTELQSSKTDLQSQLQNIQTKLTNQTALLKLDQGSVFVRWGRQSCPANTALVYSGVAGGKQWNEKGSGTNRLCLTTAPQFDNATLPIHHGFLYGAEYEYVPYHHNHYVPCSMCRAPQSTTIMMAATLTCPQGWTVQYTGHLTAANGRDYATEYVCLDYHPENYGIGKQTNHDGLLFSYVATVCGSLPCPTYENNRVVTCVVCSK